MTDTVFLDSNVFMYAAGAPHVYKLPCVQILNDIETGSLTAAISTEVLQELLYRYSHIKLATKGIQLCREVVQYPMTILPVTEADMRLAVDVFDKHHSDGLKPRDAVHVAVMQNNGIRRIVSTDGDFDAVSAIVRVDPLSYP